jgi:O-antigen ligase
MVLMVLLSLYLHEQRVERGLLYLTLVALVSYYLLMTGSRGSWLGAAVAIPLLLLDRSVGARRKVVIVLGLGLLLLRFSDAMQVRMLSVRQDESVYARRVGDLRAGWEMFLSHPLVGVGLGGYRLGVVDLRAAAGGVYEAPQASHNLFLAVLAQLGLLGFAPFVWAIGSVWGIARRNQSTVADTRGLVVSKGLSAGLLAYCVYGFLHGGLEFNLLWIVLGLLSSVGRMQPDGAGTSIGARSRGLPPGEHPKQPRLGLKV